MPHSLVKALTEKCKKFNIPYLQIHDHDDHYVCGNVHFIFIPIAEFYSQTAEQFREIVLSKVESVLEFVLELRKSLSPAVSNDLNLVLVAQPESKDKKLWRSLQNEVERDDRICRKLVWLKGKHGIGIDDFLKRTCLARPWEDASHSTSDALRLLVDGAAFCDRKTLEVLLRDELDGEDLVLALMEGFGGEIG